MKAYVRFYTIDQNSQPLHSAEASDMLQAIVYFRVAKETGKKKRKRCTDKGATGRTNYGGRNIAAWRHVIYTGSIGDISTLRAT